jgi:hypothetical protein
MPRPASKRLAARVRRCSSVSTGPFTWFCAGNGSGFTLSSPTMRMTSSTMSDLPSTSGRQVGGAIFTCAPMPEMWKPSVCRMTFCSAGCTSSPVRRFASAQG